MLYGENNGGLAMPRTTKQIAHAKATTTNHTLRLPNSPRTALNPVHIPEITSKDRDRMRRHRPRHNTVVGGTVARDRAIAGQLQLCAMPDNRPFTVLTLMDATQ